MKISQLLRDNAGIKRPSNMVERTGSEEATLYIYNVIDSYFGIGATEVVQALNSVADVPTLHVRINSPGGDVFEGRAIVEAIKRFAGKTIAHVDALAASAASSIAIAADEVEIAPGAFFMIHNASGLAYGDKAELRATADLLEKVEGTIIADYAAKTGLDESALIAWMEAETWFTGNEAVAHGFADRLAPVAEKTTSNLWNLRAYSKAPAGLQAATQPDPPEPIQKPNPEPHGTAQTNANALRLALIV